MGEQIVIEAVKPYMKSYRRRPQRTDEDVLQKTAETLAIDLHKAFPDDVVDDLADIIDQLKESIRYESDGYRICRDLENEGWSPDAEMVQVVDRVESIRQSVLDSAVANWIVDAQIEPAFKVGDTVEFLHKDRRFSGQVIDVDMRRGHYTVFCSDLGHVGKGKLGTRGLILEFEKCEAP